MRCKQNDIKSKKTYKDNYPSVLHHILDLQKDGCFTGNQYWYAMEAILKIIKESKNYEQQTK